MRLTKSETTEMSMMEMVAQTHVLWMQASLETTQKHLVFALHFEGTEHQTLTRNVTMETISLKMGALEIAK